MKEVILLQSTRETGGRPIRVAEMSDVGLVPHLHRGPWDTRTMETFEPEMHTFTRVTADLIGGETVQQVTIAFIDRELNEFISEYLHESEALRSYLAGSDEGRAYQKAVLALMREKNEHALTKAKLIACEAMADVAASKLHRFKSMSFRERIRFLFKGSSNFRTRTDRCV